MEQPLIDMTIERQRVYHLFGTVVSEPDADESVRGVNHFFFFQKKAEKDLELYGLITGAFGSGYALFVDKRAGHAEIIERGA